VYEDMPDICLDVPLAYTVLERFVERCQKGGFLTDEVIKKMPSRFVDETNEVGCYMSECPSQNSVLSKRKLFPYFSFLTHCNPDL
jgi:hypothetical protein